MLIGEPGPGFGSPSIDSTQTEMSITRPLQDIAREVFISIDESDSERTRKQSGGFSVVEDPHTTVERGATLLKGGAEGVVSRWVEHPRNFRALVGLIATGNSVLEQAGHTEDELTLLLYKGAQNELSECKNYIAEGSILGENAYETAVTTVAQSIPEAEARIVGLEEFQRKLLQRSPSKTNI